MAPTTQAPEAILGQFMPTPTSWLKARKQPVAIQEIQRGDEVTRVLVPNGQRPTKFMEYCGAAYLISKDDRRGYNGQGQTHYEILKAPLSGQQEEPERIPVSWTDRHGFRGQIEFDRLTSGNFEVPVAWYRIPKNPLTHRELPDDNEVGFIRLDSGYRFKCFDFAQKPEVKSVDGERLLLSHVSGLDLATKHMLGELKHIKDSDELEAILRQDRQPGERSIYDAYQAGVDAEGDIVYIKDQRPLFGGL